jgi:hypothetical protein
MKLFLLITSLFLLASKEKCNKQKSTSCFKGRLEIKAACMNYTVSVIDGTMDPSLVERKWTNEQTGKTYSNVFGLGSRCTFPSTIKEGDEFYFTIDSGSVQNCAVCLIYYPTPEKHLRIKVLTSPCN